MALIDHPNRLSVLLLTGVLVIALTYGYFTYRAMPEANNFTTAIAAGTELPYQLSQPDQIFYLPHELREISGLETWFDQQILCVQDEDGKVFVFDLEQQKVSSVYQFGKNRDYEGIAVRDSQIYVLESDGDLHFFDYQDGVDQYDAAKLETGFNYRNDLEGLCYDSARAAFLLVPKAQNLQPGAETSHLKGIYSYQPDSGRVKEEPVFQIDEYELGQLVYGAQERFTFRPSAIAIHPQTQQFFLLSAVGETLLVLDKNGRLEHLLMLDHTIFPQPEGLTFTTDGQLIIASEGRGREAVIAVFSPIVESPVKTDTSLQYE